MDKNGFSLVETLIALGLSLLVMLAAFGFLGITKSLFSKVKEAQESRMAVQAALLKLRIDLMQAGFGLNEPLRQGVIEGISVTGTSLLILSLDGTFALHADALSGERRIPLENVSGLSPGSRVCLAEEDKAEAHTIVALDAATIVLSVPLEATYSAAAGRLLLLKEVRYFLDERSAILRRKVNSSPAQPLLDSTGLFVPFYDREANLARMSLASTANQERTYEFSVFPKNLGIAQP